MNFLREKFQRTIFLAAEKQRGVTELSRLPKCYAPATEWEFIRPAASQVNVRDLEEA